MTEHAHDGCRGDGSLRADGAVHDARPATPSAMVCEGDVCYVPAAAGGASGRSAAYGRVARAAPALLGIGDVRDRRVEGAR